MGKDIYIHNIGTMLEPTGYAKVNRHLMLVLSKKGVHIRFTPHHPENRTVH